MKEKDAYNRARDFVRINCPGAKIYKHNDRGTKGMPDTSVTWSGSTSWLEFKMLEGEENIHNSVRFKLQLIELVRLEYQCHRAWVIAYRKPERLTIYKPTALLDLKQPVAREFSTRDNVLRDLRTYGVAQFDGFDHAAVVALIRQTHDAY
jgi:hypothetical protein